MTPNKRFFTISFLEYMYLKILDYSYLLRILLSVPHAFDGNEFSRVSTSSLSLSFLTLSASNLIIIFRNTFLLWGWSGGKLIFLQKKKHMN